MKSLSTYRGWMIGIALFILWCIVIELNRPQIDPQLLPGTWRHTIDQFDLIWTFRPAGQFSYSLKNRQTLARWMGLDLEAEGHWQLQGTSLKIELTTTPFFLTLQGQDWTGHPQTFEISQLSATKLEFRQTSPDVLTGPFELITTP